MTDLTPSFPTPQTDDELKAAIDRCFAEMRRLRALMEKDQTDIDRLKAETRAILAQLKAG